MTAAEYAKGIRTCTAVPSSDVGPLEAVIGEKPDRIILADHELAEANDISLGCDVEDADIVLDDQERRSVALVEQANRLHDVVHDLRRQSKEGFFKQDELRP